MATPRTSSQPLVKQPVMHNDGDVVKMFIGRQHQVAQLLRLMGRPSQAGTDIFIHGASKSGKTMVIRGILSKAGRQHAYVEAGDSTKPKHLFDSILSQLQNVKRKRDHGYTGAGADNAVDFVHELARVCPDNKPSAFIVVDNAQLLARSSVLMSVMQAREISCANVSFILVSSVPLSSCWFFEGVQQMVLPQVYFPAYTEQELTTILKQDVTKFVPASFSTNTSDSHRSLYNAFISSVVVSQFMPVTRSVADLRAVAVHLWKYYLEPLAKQVSIHQDLETVVRQLMSAVKPRISVVLQALQPGMCHVKLLDTAVAALGRGGAGCSQAQHAHDWGSLPLSAKLIVVSAYIASHNKASHDKAMFEATGRRGRIRGGGKAALTADRQTEAAKEARLKGPSSFTLQRLLYIYQVLYRSADHCGSSQQQATQTATDLGHTSLRHSFVATASTLRSLAHTHAATSKSTTIQLGSTRSRPQQGSIASLLSPLPYSYHQSMGENDASKHDSEHGVPGSSTHSMHAGHPTGVDTSPEDDQDPAAEFQRLLAEAQQTGKGKSARTKAKKTTTKVDDEAPAWMRDKTKTSGATAANASRYVAESATAHCPHAVSGVVRHGSAVLAPDVAPLLHSITALTNMGLLKRSAADDMLEAPRMCVGCVDEALAAELARDCGVKLHNFLKYA